MEEVLREGGYWIENAGDGIFVCLRYVPSKEEEKAIYKRACEIYEDVQWCPDPCQHGEGAEAVLNRFYQR